MWLSERSARSAGEQEPAAELGTVTIGGRSAAVELSGEARSVRTVSAGGYVWRPARGQEVLVLKCGDEGEVILGAAAADEPSGMKDGEVYITSGSGSSVHLKADGSIAVSGKVELTGSLYINGYLCEPALWTLGGS